MSLQKFQPDFGQPSLLITAHKKSLPLYVLLPLSSSHHNLSKLDTYIIFTLFAMRKKKDFFGLASVELSRIDS